jgi:hypothetical protein
LGKGLGKKEEPGREKGTTDQSEARQLEENLLQQGDSDTQLHLKVSLELSCSQVVLCQDCEGEHY